MARTYGALGPRGDFMPTQARPDLRAAPRQVRAGPAPSRRKAESAGDRVARRRKERREGVMFRENLKKAMRENRRYKEETEDSDRNRDFAYREAIARAPREREAMDLEMQLKAQAPEDAMKMAEMEDSRRRDLGRMESDSRVQAAMMQGGGRGGRGGAAGGDDMDKFIEILAGAGMGDHALALMMSRLGRGGGGPGMPGGGQPEIPGIPGSGDLMDRGPGAGGPAGMPEGMMKDIGRKMQGERRGRMMEDEGVKAWLEEMGGTKDATWARRMVGLPEGSEGFWGAMSGAGTGFFGGGDPKPRYGNIMQILKEIQGMAPGGYGDPESAKALLSKLVNTEDFYDEFASDVPWAPGNEGQLRQQILRMIRESSLK